VSGSGRISAIPAVTRFPPFAWKPAAASRCRGKGDDAVADDLRIS
jgi:hypothetical protein